MNRQRHRHRHTHHLGSQLDGVAGHFLAHRLGAVLRDVGSGVRNQHREALALQPRQQIFPPQEVTYEHVRERAHQRVCALLSVFVEQTIERVHVDQHQDRLAIHQQTELRHALQMVHEGRGVEQSRHLVLRGLVTCCLQLLLEHSHMGAQSVDLLFLAARAAVESPLHHTGDGRRLSRDAIRIAPSQGVHQATEGRTHFAVLAPICADARGDRATKLAHRLPQR